ncbi:protoporphyrinogen oxidase [Microbacterium sediminicola]|uniref:Protoporphyrinogen oxidase n=1 Tax=Microbacterium sediminicola TaxID=415210 RepID=A0ABP4U267_9MICO
MNPDVCVVGAGIAGLVIAAETAAAGLRTVVFEHAAVSGGMLAARELEGMAVDAGAEAFATRTDAVPELVRRWDLPLEIVTPAPTGAWLVFGHGRHRRRAPLPAGSILGIPADPFAADVAPFGDPHAESEAPLPTDEPSLRDLVADRLGARIADVLVDTVTRGVYSRPAREVRLSQVQPQLWREAQARGSLTAAVAHLSTGQRLGSAVAGIRGGMWRLPIELEKAAGARGASFAHHTEVLSVTPKAEGVRVDVPKGSVTARAVVLATPGSASARLLGTSAPISAPVELAIARVRSPALDRHPVGTGALVATDAGLRAKALTHATAKWAWLAQAMSRSGGDHIVRLSARHPGPGLDDPRVVASEITAITGAEVDASEIVALHSQHWDAAASTGPGLQTPAGVHLAGAQVAGTGLASVIPHARALAAELIQTLALAPPPKENR